LDEDALVDSPKVQLIQEKQKKKIVDERSQSPKVITKEQFINEC
jgi:hypothetical protein